MSKLVGVVIPMHARIFFTALFFVLTFSMNSFPRVDTELKNNDQLMFKYKSVVGITQLMPKQDLEFRTSRIVQVASFCVLNCSLFVGAYLSRSLKGKCAWALITVLLDAYHILEWRKLNEDAGKWLQQLKEKEALDKNDVI